MTRAVPGVYIRPISYTYNSVYIRVYGENGVYAAIAAKMHIRSIAYHTYTAFLANIRRFRRICAYIYTGAGSNDVQTGITRTCTRPREVAETCAAILLAISLQ
jgi:hypothetical protein